MNSALPTSVDAQVNIPVIDFDDVNETPRRLLDAATTYGFIFVKHTESLPFTPDAVQAMFDLSKDFFTSPDDVKSECTINIGKSGKNHGWAPMHSERLDPNNQKKGDFKEVFNLGEFKSGKAQQPLPEPLQKYEEQLGKFQLGCHLLCMKILQQLAAALKIPEESGGLNWFSARHDKEKGPSGSILRLLYYPAVPEDKLPDPTEDIRAGAHSDYGSCTLLFRLPGQPGLEIQTPTGGWATVPTDPDPNRSSSTLPILVNIGDLMEFWTNGLLKSTVHRVVFPRVGDSPTEGQDRYSIAYFCHPLDDVGLVEIPSHVVQMEGEKNPNRAKPRDKTMTARDHLNDRLAATYRLPAHGNK